MEVNKEEPYRTGLKIRNSYSREKVNLIDSHVTSINPKIF